MVSVDDVVRWATRYGFEPEKITGLTFKAYGQNFTNFTNFTIFTPAASATPAAPHEGIL